MQLLQHTDMGGLQSARLHASMLPNYFVIYLVIDAERNFLKHTFIYKLFKKLNVGLIRVRVLVLYCHLVTHQTHSNNNF